VSGMAALDSVVHEASACRAKIHFISGLPRSGSTLLSALLAQNPRFHAGITGPLAPMCGSVHQQISGNAEFAALFDDRRIERILKGLVDAYYFDVFQSKLIFDTNRSWTARASLIAALYPQARIVCCVRSVGWIIDSIERLRARFPLKVSRLFPQHASSLYARVDALMNSETGLIGSAWSMLREAWFSEFASRLIVLPYDTLVSHPERTMRRLYRELNEHYFSHDFDHVEHEAVDYDENLGLPGLHTVRRVVAPIEREPVIPPDLFARYSGSHFWDDPDLNPRNVVVL
jgi:sulfotransferase